jgi:hypothetical protein
MIMDERRPLNSNACNHEQVRSVIRDIDANFAIVFDELKKLRSEFDARTQSEPGARPT